MNRIAIIGAGAMGSGIAQIAATHGHEVLIYDAQQAATQRARDNINASLNKLVSKGKLTDQEAVATFGRLYFVDQLSSAAECDLIIEAIREDERDKQELFQKLSHTISPNTILASNTSSLSITRLATAAKYPEQFIGIHFFNPPVLMPLVEIIPALQTAPAVVQHAYALMDSWGKTCVIAKDTPGFIVNRIARPYYGEALRIAEEQLATPAEIDMAMKAFGGFKMGPFELMDFIGHDVNYAVTQSVWHAMYNDPRYKPSLLQANLVHAGWLGRKSGRGFYNYTSASEEQLIIRREEHKFIFDRILAMLINEAADAEYLGIASASDIDKAMTLGVNYPKGLLQWADEIGIANAERHIDALYMQYHEERYRCSQRLRSRQPFFA
jgi:3-hydroxybutyryl-CoA dehydrogenase